jgi:hypothetical protein
VEASQCRGLSGSLKQREKGVQRMRRAQDLADVLVPVASLEASRFEDLEYIGPGGQLQTQRCGVNVSKGGIVSLFERPAGQHSMQPRHLGEFLYQVEQNPQSCRVLNHQIGQRRADR